VAGVGERSSNPGVIFFVPKFHQLPVMRAFGRTTVNFSGSETAGEAKNKRSPAFSKIRASEGCLA